MMRVEPQQRRGAGEERVNVSHHEGERWRTEDRDEVEERVGGDKSTRRDKVWGWGMLTVTAVLRSQKRVDFGVKLLHGLAPCPTLAL